MEIGVLTFTGGGSIPKTVGNRCIFITANELLPNIQYKINEVHLIYKVRCILGVGRAGLSGGIECQSSLKTTFSRMTLFCTTGMFLPVTFLKLASFLHCADKRCYFLLLSGCLPTSWEPGNQSGSLWNMIVKGGDWTVLEGWWEGWWVGVSAGAAQWNPCAQTNYIRISRAEAWHHNSVVKA